MDSAANGHRKARARNTPAQRLFDVDCKLSYTLLDDTHFLFLVHALDGMDQEVLEESLRITPSLEHELHADAALCHRTLRLKAPDRTPHAALSRPRAAVSPAAEQARARGAHRGAAPRGADGPDADALLRVRPTRLGRGKLFGDCLRGYARVQAVSDWIHEHIEYRTGSTDTTTTACDVFLQRAGVCRDFAHLGVTFCRSLNIPARLAVGYARFDIPPPDFHAFFEAFLGGRWELFDPTGMTDPNDLVRIAVGRDAGDVAFATLFGPVRTRLIRPEVEQVRSRRARARA